MKNYIVSLLLILVICLFFSVNLLQPFLYPSSANSASAHPQYLYWVIISSYICVIFVVFLNRENLALYNIDKLSLLILVLAGAIRVYLHTANEALYKNIILALSLTLLCLTMFNWNKIPNTDMSWVYIGILSCAIVVPVAFAESFQLSKYSISNTLYGDHFSEYAIRNFLYNLAIVAPFEEIIFRGALWGELRKRQFGEGKIFWFQGFLFWGLHFWSIFTPITFFVALPIGILVFSLLAKYSKQISPSMISHTLFNTLSPMLVYFISTLL